MRRIITAMGLAALALAVIGVSTAPGASAHERRAVAGKYTFVVGWLTEPALLDEPNGIDLRISDAQTNTPIEGLEKTLKADVTAAGQTKTFDLTARFGQAGAYTANIIPTKTGGWAFRFYGTVQGTQIDEKFESGPNTFGDVQPRTDLQFPVKEPSIGELAAQVGATGDNTQAATAPSPAMAEAQRAIDRANSARTMGIGFGVAGIVVGLIGIALAAYALSTRRRSGARSSSEPV